MKLLGDRKVHEQIFHDGLKSKKHSVLIENPEAFDKQKYEENQKRK